MIISGLLIMGGTFLFILFLFGELRYIISGNKHFRMLISLVREQEFIEELKAINPNIYVNVPLKKEKWRILD